MLSFDPSMRNREECEQRGWRFLSAKREECWWMSDKGGLINGEGHKYRCPWQQSMSTIHHRTRIMTLKPDSTETSLHYLGTHATNSINRALVKSVNCGLNWFLGDAQDNLSGGRKIEAGPGMSNCTASLKRANIQW